jgi:hypothetical protein
MPRSSSISSRNGNVRSRCTSTATRTIWPREAYWNGYIGDWHNLSFNNSFVLYKDETYNYTIRTGSYPQIIRAESKDVTGGRITCEEFVDINGKRHEGWIPAIRLL